MLLLLEKQCRGQTCVQAAVQEHRGVLGLCPSSLLLSCVQLMQASF